MWHVALLLLTLTLIAASFVMLSPVCLHVVAGNQCVNVVTGEYSCLCARLLLPIIRCVLMGAAGMYGMGVAGSLLGRQCTNNAGGYSCPSNYSCENVGPNPYANLVSFDNVPSSLLVIFMTTTLDGWTTIMFAVTPLSRRRRVQLHTRYMAHMSSWMVCVLLRACRRWMPLIGWQRCSLSWWSVPYALRFCHVLFFYADVHAPLHQFCVCRSM